MYGGLQLVLAQLNAPSKLSKNLSYGPQVNRGSGIVLDISIFLKHM